MSIKSFLHLHQLVQLEYIQLHMYWMMILSFYSDAYQETLNLVELELY